MRVREEGERERKKRQGKIREMQEKRQREGTVVSVAATVTPSPMLIIFNMTD